MKAIAESPTTANFFGISAKETDRICIIIRAVENHTRVSWESIFSRRRTERVAHARQLAMTLIRRTSDLSLMEVGEIFSRGHDTVIHALKAVDSRLSDEPGFASLYETLLSQAKA